MEYPETIEIKTDNLEENNKNKKEEELYTNKLINIKDENINSLINNKKDDNIYKKIITCSKCDEICFINLNDYKINLFGCKNGHTINNISFENYKNNIKNAGFNITCDKCKKNLNNKELYKCFTCNSNICFDCKLNHNKEHKVVNNDKINYICIEHNAKYSIKTIKQYIMGIYCRVI